MNILPFIILVSLSFNQSFTENIANEIEIFNRQLGESLRTVKIGPFGLKHVNCFLFHPHCVSDPSQILLKRMNSILYLI